MKRIQALITVCCITFILLHIFFPKIGIDAITLTLLTLSFIPWLAPLFKSLELPGGWKFEFQELERVKKEAEKVGLISEKTKTEKYQFIEISKDYPNLALAGLRMELEKSLKNLAIRKGVNMERKQGLTRTIRELSRTCVLSEEEVVVLLDMAGTLNQGVHGLDLDERTVNWVMEVGPKILKAIEER